MASEIDHYLTSVWLSFSFTPLELIASNAVPLIRSVHSPAFGTVTLSTSLCFTASKSNGALN